MRITRDACVITVGTCACMLMQEPSEPQDPPEELAEPWYFTDPKLLGRELQSMEAANEAATERLEVNMTS
jgi:hypothetical protein